MLWTLNQEFLWALSETLCCVPGVAKTPHFHCTFLHYSNQVWEWLPCRRLASGPNRKLTYPLSLLMLQCIMEWQGWACMATCFWLECKLDLLHVHVPTSHTISLIVPNVCICSRYSTIVCMQVPLGVLPSQIWEVLNMTSHWFFMPVNLESLQPHLFSLHFQWLQ